MERVSKSEPLISVIVPIYNVEDYLDKCINSILNQTYKNLEIILVDDGSPDNCPKMCDEYAKKDNRIKVIHKKNGGLSDARNKGIEIANGEYITFVDSDDYLSNDCIELLYINIVKYDSDISIGGHQVVYDNGKIINKYSNTEYVSTPKEVLDKILYSDGIDLSAWAKLYKRNLFNNIKYPVGRIYEDAATTYKLVDISDKISIISKPIYYYIIRNDSISNNSFTEKKMDLIVSTKEMTDYVRQKYPELSRGCDRRLMYSYLSTLTQLAKSKQVDNNIKLQLVSFIKKNRKLIMKDNRAPFRDKLGIISLLFGFRFYKAIWKFYSLIRSDAI